MRKAHRAIWRAAAFLTLGLLLEVTATLWTAAQVVSSGAFEHASCGELSRFLYEHVQFLDGLCEEVGMSEVLASNGSMSIRTATLEILGTSGKSYTWLTENFTACATPKEQVHPEGCTCTMTVNEGTSPTCFWVAAETNDSSLGNLAGECLAFPIYSDTGIFSSVIASCGSTNPLGLGVIVAAMLAASLGIELVEALLGYKHLRSPLGETRLLAAGSVAEGVATATVACLLKFTSHGFVSSSGELSNQRLTNLQNYTSVVLALTCLGTVAEVSFLSSTTASHRLPYLGAFGNGLVWLSAAGLEVVVPVYLAIRVRYSTRIDEDLVGVIGGEVVALIVVEFLALVLVWTYRVLMVRIKMMLRTLSDPGVQDFSGVFDVGVRPQEVGDAVR
ncbi:unnamed protein product [Scytosiphon promiscuus]